MAIRVQSALLCVAACLELSTSCVHQTRTVQKATPAAAPMSNWDRQVRNALDAGDGDYRLRALRETVAADENPELGRQYLRDTFGQGYWAQRERFVSLLEWLAQLSNAVGMEEWAADSLAARILAGRLRNDHA